MVRKQPVSMKSMNQCLRRLAEQKILFQHHKKKHFFFYCELCLLKWFLGNLSILNIKK